MSVNYWGELNTGNTDPSYSFSTTVYHLFRYDEHAAMPAVLLHLLRCSLPTDGLCSSSTSLVGDLKFNPLR